ncbi:MAG: hypothetical protein COB40_03110 [Marinosulfonomonas sp.]|nr:MAG: hypothetical protein COB40_03110 [Marinosulfonomonas sp.]
MRTWRIIGVLAVLAILAGCGAAEPKWASEADVKRAAYVHDGPPTITLFTVINNKNGSGAHSALMVNASQRVIFDPAGTWRHPQLPERNDVIFGMSDPIVDFYIDYHSRITYRTVVQEIVVSPEVAQLAMQGILSYGAVPKAQCANAITTILADIPGFENFPHTWFPKKLSAEFGKLPGASFEVIYDNSPDDNSGVVVGPQADYMLRG